MTTNQLWVSYRWTGLPGLWTSTLCNIPAWIKTWVDSTFRVMSQCSNQFGQRVRPTSKRLTGWLGCHSIVNFCIQPIQFIWKLRKAHENMARIRPIAIHLKDQTAFPTNSWAYTALWYSVSQFAQFVASLVSLGYIGVINYGNACCVYQISSVWSCN